MIITALIAIALLALFYGGVNFIIWALTNHEQKFLNTAVVILLGAAFVIAYGMVEAFRRQLGL